MLMLSPHFSLDEMTRSEKADELGIDNIPDDESIKNMTLLCVNVLELIRNHFDAPVKILSGFRCKELNRAVKGKPSSQHLTGEAADIRVGCVRNDLIFDYVRTHLEYDQLIAERLKRLEPQAGWIHVSYSSKRLRNEALSYMGGGLYLNGLVYTVY